MTVVINLRNEDEEKVLFAFLNSLHYDYKTTPAGYELTDEQQKEIIKRDNDLVAGKTTARTWDDIKKDLESVYR